MATGTVFDRRHMLFAAAGLTGVALAERSGRRHSPLLDLQNPRVALDTYVKLRGATDDQTVFQPYDGDIFQVVDGRVSTPLCGFRGLQKSVWRRTAEGYVNRDFDLGFYVDYQTREILKRWRNPLTGADVEVFHYRGGPSGGHFTVGARSNDVYGEATGRWSVAGDQLWHTTANWGERPNPLKPAEWPLASSGETRLGSMSLTFAGRIPEVADPAVHQARSLQVWTNTTSWMPWMEMGQRPGFNLWRWVGAKGTPVQALDPELVAAAERVWPGYVSADRGWTTPTSGLQDYMRLKRGLPLLD